MNICGNFILLTFKMKIKHENRKYSNAKEKKSFVLTMPV